MNYHEAWRSVLGQLRMEMLRASFDTWVRDTEAISLEEDVLTVFTHSANARDWLESRLTSTVQRLLVGILNLSVSVHFVVRESQDEEIEPVDDEDEQEVGIEPVQCLDVRPYPVTLVRWPTAIRNGGMPTSSGSGGVNYISNGGGSSGNPHVGDWRDLRLTLTLRPASPLSITLPKVGTFDLADAGSSGNPTLIQWEVPSHPAVGAGPLAGSVSGLEELPADIPLFVGRGHGAYKLYWEIRYHAYEPVEECVFGPNGNGVYNCGGGTGHKVVVDYEWKRHSQGGEIPPLAVQNVPVSRLADINGDGVRMPSGITI